MIDHEELKKVYFETQSITKTANYFGVTYSAIKYYIDKLGLSIILERPRITISNEDVVKLYKEHQSIRKVSKILGISTETIRVKLHECESCNKPLRFSYDKDFFSRDNEESFYWAGFIAADGNIPKNPNNKNIGRGIRITLAIKDKELMDAYKKSMKYSGEVWTTDETCGLRIYCPKLAQDILRFNVVPAKTKIYRFPEWIVDHELVNHFMRGYVDGDGCFFYENLWGKGRKIDQVHFNVRGTMEFLTVFGKVLSKRCGIKEKYPRLNCGIGSLECGGNIIVGRLAEFLYKDATLYLKRKYNIAKHAIDRMSLMREKKRQQQVEDFRYSAYKYLTTYHRELTKEHLIKLYAEHKSIQKIAKIVHKRQETISEMLDNFGIEKIDNKLHVTKEELQQLYDKHGSIMRVANELGYSFECIRRKMHRSGII